jgi:two-component system, NtrC family, response regulator HydG
MDTPRHILVLDKDQRAYDLLFQALSPAVIDVVTTSAAAIDKLVSYSWDAIVFDPYADELNDDAALTLLRKIRTAAPDTVAVPWCDLPTVSFAVRAMRGGALDVVRKDTNSDDLRRTIERAMAHGALSREVKRLRGEVERARGIGDVIGDSSLMRQLLAVVERIASSDATVLIVGESGTGKELLARTIHRVGPRRDGPFVGFDCSALAPSLLEDELFGHEKGAFTGAMRARRGLFREAQGGTIFLDEIGDIDASVQNKLLRVLQEREIKPVGSERTVPIDVRVVAATNKDLKQLVARGLFREDLYWRLAVVPVMVPPLRERTEDIPKLAAHILARRRGAAKSFAGTEARYPTQITGRALARLAGYRWPGNIRELENVLSRAAILCDGEIIREDDLDLVGLESNAPSAASHVETLAANETQGSLKELVARATRIVERTAIETALAQTGSATLAAQRLGISRAGLYNKMKEYAIVARSSAQ